MVMSTIDYIYINTDFATGAISQGNIFMRKTAGVYLEPIDRILVMRQRASHSNTEKVGQKLPPDRE